MKVLAITYDGEVERVVIQREDGSSFMYLRRELDGPMPFDRADHSGFGLVHATGYEYYDGYSDSWRTEYEDDIEYQLICEALGES